MAFDILGIVHYDQLLKKTAVSEGIYKNLFYERTDSGQISLAAHNYKIIFLSHDKKKEDFVENERICLIMIGEPVLNSNGEGIVGEAKIPLTARELSELYNNFNTKFIEYIKGNFAIFIINKKTNEVLIFNSRFGISPIYYYFRNDIFLFSTNLSAIIRIQNDEFDNVGLAEYALLGYPLGDKTFFKNIRCLIPGAKLIVKKNFCACQKYWNITSLFPDKLYSEKEAWDMGIKLFKKIVNLYAQKPEKICLSLTSGFDSRAILSVLEKEPKELLCYSFGIAGSENITIPSKICKENKINYLPIYLDNNYEMVYNKFGMEAILFSDCLATFERANYPYAFKILSSFSPVIITGIFGSELMRTFQNISIGYMVNKNFVNLNFARDKKKIMASIINQLRQDSYYASHIFTNDEGIIEHIYEECFKKYEGFTDNQRFYLFLLNEGVRKYFAGEVQMERIYATNRFPYLDDDFVDFIFKSPFCGIYTNPLKPTLKQRLNSQLFYSYVIKRYRPQLLNYPTDHGYAPKHLLSHIPLLSIGPSFIIKRLRRKLKKYREFKTDKWSENFYRKYLMKISFKSSLFSKRILDDFISGRWKENRIDFARAISLKLYLENIIKS